MTPLKGVEYGICRVSLSPMRKTSDDKSEMVSQLLFGELVEIYQKKKKTWYKVVSTHDDYLGWVDVKHILKITENEFQELKNCTSFALDWVNPASSGNLSLPICAGSNLHAFDGLTFKSPIGRFQYSGQIINSEQIEVNSELICKLARQYLNAPYLWGGRSPFGIDCSGFTQVIFKMLGFDLPRDASQQVEMGEVVEFNVNTRIGDLAFFVNKENKIIHVGILMEDDKIIHASGWVKEDTLDHFGIYNKETKKYTHVLRIIKRLIPDLP